MRPLELTRSGILGTVAVVVVAAVCVRLGLWQLDRRQERLAHNAVVSERLAAPAVSLDAVPADTAGLTHRRAAVDGVLDEGRTVVLAGRSHAGRPGVHVYSPVRVRGGAVLVNRGWLPAADAATVDLASIERPDSVRFEGVLLPFPELDLPPRPDTGFQRTWYRLDGPGIRKQYPYPVATLYVQATADRAALPGSPSRAGGAARGGSAGGPAVDAATGAPVAPIRLEPPALDAGPHLSYAIQWFSFATIFLVGWVVLLLKRGDETRPRPPTRNTGAADGAPPGTGSRPS